MQGATAKELMRGGGHSSSAGALRYQHATTDPDGALGDALGEMAEAATVVPLRQTKVD